MNVKFSILKLPAIFFVMIARHLPVSHEIDKMRHWTQIHRSAIKKDLWFIALLLYSHLIQCIAKYKIFSEERLLIFAAHSGMPLDCAFPCKKFYHP